MPEKFSKSKLNQKPKGQLVDLLLDWQNMPEPEPVVEVREVEKEVFIEAPIEETSTWKPISETKIVEVLARFRDSIVSTLRPNPMKTAPGPAITVEAAVAEILESTKDTDGSN